MHMGLSHQMLCALSSSQDSQHQDVDSLAASDEADDRDGVQEVELSILNRDEPEQKDDDPPMQHDALVNVQARQSNEEEDTSSSNMLSTWRFFFGALAATLTGMTAATFSALGGGKVGLILVRDVFTMTNPGIVDVTLMAGEHATSITEQSNTAPSLSLDTRMIKRSICWIGIGVALGVNNALWYITFQPACSGVKWQPKPILSMIFNSFIHIWLTGRTMMQAHRDISPKLWRWWVCIMSALALGGIGRSSPYPFISWIGDGLVFLISTFALYVVVNRLDLKVEREHVRNGYKLLVASASMFISYQTLNFASRDLRYLTINSVLIMLWQKAVFSVIIPACKKCFGDDDRKLWSYAVPALIFGLELGQCSLFLRSELGAEFTLLLMVQEANSVAKNTGMYDAFEAFVRGRIGRPINEITRKRMEEKRAILAPCDNIGEILSPVVLIVVISLEALFGKLGIERAPFLAYTGILGQWRRTGEGQSRSVGETPSMLAIVLIVRIVFCWIELKVRRHQSRSHHLDDLTISSSADGAPQNTDGVGEDTDGNTSPRTGAATRRRRSSINVLYARIVHSRESHMRYLAVGLFCLQPIILVCVAAALGKKMRILSESASCGE